MPRNNNSILHNYLANLRLDILLMASGKTVRNCEGENIKTRSNRLYYITGGTCRFHINNEIVDVCGGSLLLIPSGAVISFGNVDGVEFERYVCHFVADFGNQNFFDFFEFPYKVQIDEEKPRRFMTMLFEDLMRCNDLNDIPSAFKTQADVMRVLSCFVESSAMLSGGVRVSRDKGLQPILSYIEEHYRDDLTITYLADVVHLHPNYFIKSFKKQFGMPPIQYINKLRLRKARYALLNTSDTVQSIAVDCGFNGQSQFSKAFRQQYSISPSEYRKTYMEQE